MIEWSNNQDINLDEILNKEFSIDMLQNFVNSYYETESFIETNYNNINSSNKLLLIGHFQIFRLSNLDSVFYKLKRTRIRWLFYQQKQTNIVKISYTALLRTNVSTTLLIQP